MTCRSAERWISDDLDGRLSEGRRVRLAAHIAECRDCRDYRDRLEIIQRETGDILHPILPEGHWEDWEVRLKSRLETAADDPKGIVGPVRPLRPAWKWAWAGATVGGLAVLAVLVLAPRRPAEEYPAFYPGEATVYFENEMTRNPALAESFNRILAASIDEIMQDSGIRGNEWLWDDPLFWESLSLEEMEMIEAGLKATNGS